jgi:CHAD domain-containing protein
MKAFLLQRLTGSEAAAHDLLLDGMQRLGLPLPGPPPDPALRLDPRDDVQDAARKVLARQAAALRAQRRGAVLALDPEFVHQLRVAARRARSALRLFEPWLDPAAPRLRKELGELGRGLGRLRDLDVLLVALRSDLAAVGAAPEAKEKVLSAFETRRRAAHEDAVRHLTSPSFERMVAALETMKGGGGGGPAPVMAETSRVLETAAKKVRRRARRSPADMSEEDRHRLRIAVKRLRYAAESLADLEDEPTLEAVRRLVRCQDVLGDARDATTAAEAYRGLARLRCADPRPDAEELLVLGALVQKQHKKKSSLLRKFEKLWAKLPRHVKDLERGIAALERSAVPRRWVR